LVHYEQTVRGGGVGDRASAAGAAAAVRAAGVGLGKMDMGEMDSKKTDTGKADTDVELESECSSESEVEAESSNLPPLVWEMLLARIPPADVCRLARTSRVVRDAAQSDFVWQRQFEARWGAAAAARVAGRARWEWVTNARHVHQRFNEQSIQYYKLSNQVNKQSIQ